MIKFVLNILFPNKCGFCGNINVDGLCSRCNYKLKDLSECKINKVKNMYFEEHIYLFKYQDEIRKKIIEFKFEDKPYLAKTFMNFLLKNKKICGFLKNYDIIIPVPMYSSKKAERGYNQAELLAKELEGIIPYQKDVLVKILDTEKQSKLKKYERTHNLENAYKVLNSDIIKNKNIILIDDIYTTGSTANECSKTLKNAGAKRICILTIAKD